MRPAVLLLFAAGAAAAQEYPTRTAAFAQQRAAFTTNRDAFGSVDDWFPWKKDGGARLALAPENARTVALPPFPLRLRSTVELDPSSLPRDLPDGPTVQTIRAEVAPMRYEQRAALVYVGTHGNPPDGWLPIEQLPVGAWRLDGWWLQRVDAQRVEAGERYPEDADGVKRAFQRLRIRDYSDGDVEAHRAAGAELNRAIEFYVAKGTPLRDATLRVRREAIEIERQLIVAYAGAFASAAGMLAGGPAPEELAATMKPRTLAERQRYRAPTVRSGGEGVTDETSEQALNRARYVPKPGEKLIWPDNKGFDGAPKATTLEPGTRIDRFGPETGQYTSPAGTPLPQRALPPGSESRPLHTYEVLKPIEVEGGKIAPWFGQPGGGTQYLMPASIRDLIKAGYLREVF